MVIIASILFLVLFGVSDIRAEITTVTLITDRGEKVSALFDKPASAGRHPAVIFNHGTEVRRDGYKYARTDKGQDLDGFIQALVRQGYVTIAPLRTLLAKEATLDRGRIVGSPEQWTEVIAYGLRVVGTARRFVAERPDVNPEAIAIVGYSEGGNSSLWSAIETPGYRAVVLLSPAAIPPSPRYRLRAATKEELLTRIQAPVFLAVATDDFKGIREVTSEALIPNLKKVNPAFRYRNDYPGEHNWFWKVRNEFWSDVAAFLKEHLQ